MELSKRKEDGTFLDFKKIFQIRIDLPKQVRQEEMCMQC